MASTRTLTATDPLTGQTVTRRTARTYHAAIVWTGANGALHVYGWAGRPDLAETTLKKVHRAGVTDARLAPVTADPWAAAPAPVEPVAPAPAPAPAPVERVTVAEPVAPAAPEPVAAVAQARPRSLAPLAADLGQSLGLDRRGELRAQAAPIVAVMESAPYPIRHNGTDEPIRGPLLPGESGHTPAPVAQGPGPALPTLATLRDDAAAGRPVSLTALARRLAVGLSEPAPTPDSLKARAAARSAEGDRLAAAGDPAGAVAAASQAATLTAWADQISPAPTGDAWAGQPWDPGTPEARARVALQGERVATLWPVAQALTGAGVTLPASWAGDGPVMAGEWPYDRALAALPLGAIAAAAAALAALPPVTRAQARALQLCRGQAPTG